MLKPILFFLLIINTIYVSHFLGCTHTVCRQKFSKLSNRTHAKSSLSGLEFLSKPSQIFTWCFKGRPSSIKARRSRFFKILKMVPILCLFSSCCFMYLQLTGSRYQHYKHMAYLKNHSAKSSLSKAISKSLPTRHH